MIFSTEEECIMGNVRLHHLKKTKILLFECDSKFDLIRRHLSIYFYIYVLP